MTSFSRRQVRCFMSLHVFFHNVLVTHSSQSKLYRAESSSFDARLQLLIRLTPPPPPPPPTLFFFFVVFNCIPTPSTALGTGLHGMASHTTTHTRNFFFLLPNIVSALKKRVQQSEVTWTHLRKAQKKIIEDRGLMIGTRE